MEKSRQPYRSTTWTQPLKSPSGGLQQTQLCYTFFNRLLFAFIIHFRGWLLQLIFVIARLNEGASFFQGESAVHLCKILFSLSAYVPVHHSWRTDSFVCSCLYYNYLFQHLSSVRCCLSSSFEKPSRWFEIVLLGACWIIQGRVLCSEWQLPIPKDFVRGILIDDPMLFCASRYSSQTFFLNDRCVKALQLQIIAYRPSDLEKTSSINKNRILSAGYRICSVGSRILTSGSI